MKKIVLVISFMLVFGASVGFAAPVNNLSKGQTAIGLLDDSFYIEHKLTNKITVGLGNDDIYGQYDFNSNFRASVGSRDYNSTSSFYIGAAVNTVLAPDLDGYASLIGADDFKELQVGINYKLTKNFDVNVNYRSFMPDQGSNSDRTSVGATFKF